MNHIRLVAARELKESFRSKAYWVTIGLMLVGVVAIIGLPRLLGDDPSYDLGVAGVPPSGMEADLMALADAFDVEVTMTDLADPVVAEAAVLDDRVDAALVFVDDEEQGAALLRRAGTSTTLTAIAGQAATSSITRSRVVDVGLDTTTAEAALAVPPPTDMVVDDDQPGRRAVASLMTFVLYITLFMGGMGIATGVAVEKSTRIAEVLVTTVRPSRLLAGKVLGFGISTLLIVLAGAVPFLVAVVLDLVEVPAASTVDVVGGVGWFVIGFLMYATGFAALGALVDRQEDLGGAIAPFATALIAAYMAALYALGSPNSLLAQITSLFPLTAPVVMPARVAADAASVLEITVAVGLCAATAIFLARVGGVIYRRALLRGGRRLRLTEVLSG